MAQSFVSAANSLLTTASGISLELNWTVLVELALFGAIWFFLTKQVFKPYLAARDQREELTEGARKEAAALEAQATETLTSCEAQVQTARDVATTSREKKAAEALQVAREKREAAQASSQQTLATERAKISRELSAAREAMAPQIEEISASIVKKVMAA